MNNYSFIVSAGASPVFNSLEVLRLLGFDIEIVLISDRKCEALNTANEKGITNFLYHNSDRHSFSQFASEKINLLNTNLTFSLFHFFQNILTQNLSKIALIFIQDV